MQAGALSVDPDGAEFARPDRNLALSDGRSSSLGESVRLRTPPRPSGTTDRSNLR
ncbi:hypothetical protein ACNS7O_17190 (plasmid) [Haloferacaceae archaeon DSL9]